MMLCQASYVNAYFSSEEMNNRLFLKQIAFLSFVFEKELLKDQIAI